MKKSSIFGLIVIAIAIATIITTYSSSSTYGSFSDAKKTTDELHIVGHLDKSKELYYDATKDANYFSFFIKDNKGEECKVIFTGTKPQDFEKSEQIVLTGRMNGKEFHASTILMKCPSKYTQDKVEVTEAKAKTAQL
ncbi:cytochrome c maturation protein CcmE domain-containing protein [Mucilaginibacter xinganensis]|uniref:Cytochrome C biogenesis protein n=1 Tax=Mucilaginibacter xinganensis TaxID=1234841 RepID=A0A223NZS1_9SPHI|nr:cytochrome c maturation protein CcmE [Mucilaginibacter xinganensis]ASU35355.1 cytochrome C biogenesis protein [Mucilaginibacter xinganensis]